MAGVPVTKQRWVTDDTPPGSGVDSKWDRPPDYWTYGGDPSGQYSSDQISEWVPKDQFTGDVKTATASSSGITGGWRLKTWNQNPMQSWTPGEFGRTETGAYKTQPPSYDLNGEKWIYSYAPGSEPQAAPPPFENTPPPEEKSWWPGKDQGQPPPAIQDAKPAVARTSYYDPYEFSPIKSPFEQPPTQQPGEIGPGQYDYGDGTSGAKPPSDWDNSQEGGDAKYRQPYYDPLTDPGYTPERGDLKPWQRTPYFPGQEGAPGPTWNPATFSPQSEAPLFDPTSGTYTPASQGSNLPPAAYYNPATGMFQ